MDPTARLHSANLELVARAIAKWTVSRHAERAAAMGTRSGDGWHEAWLAETCTRLDALAQAIAVRRPALFVEATRSWGAALAAHAVDPADIMVNLRCMREVISDELGDPLRSIALRYVDAALAGLEASPVRPALPACPDLEAPHGGLALAYMQTLLAGDHKRAEALVLHAASDGVSVASIFEHVFRPALLSIGSLWYAGEVSVAYEHFATSTTESIMAMLRPRFPCPAPRNRRAVATAAGGEMHMLGARMVADFLEMAGWSTMYLGGNMPLEDMLHLLRDQHVDVLAVSATTFRHVRALGDLIDATRNAPGLGGVRVLVGGLVFEAVPDLWEELGADACATSASEAVHVANAMLDEDGEEERCGARAA